jgi:DNA-binding response OmpR family regulator
MLSGHIDPRLRTSAVSAGADEYISKPFDPDDLLMRIRRRLAVGVRERGRR